LSALAASPACLRDSPAYAGVEIVEKIAASARS
jgi:hypothetical protein